MNNYMSDKEIEALIASNECADYDWSALQSDYILQSIKDMFVILHSKLKQGELIEDIEIYYLGQDGYVYDIREDNEHDNFRFDTEAKLIDLLSTAINKWEEHNLCEYKEWAREYLTN